jgi:hypothetical protein
MRHDGSKKQKRCDVTSVGLQSLILILSKNNSMFPTFKHRLSALLRVSFFMELIKSKKKSKAVPLHAMEAHGVKGGTHT